MSERQIKSAVTALSVVTGLTASVAIAFTPALLQVFVLSGH